jgi:hypothetical protein
MAIKVGINKGVKLSVANTQINDKGTLSINFNQGAPEQSVDDLLSTNSGVKNSNGTNIMLWPVSVESNGEVRKVDYISGDLASLRDQLEHILSGYMTTDKAKLDPYAETGLTAANFSAEIVKQAIVDKIYKNLTTQFIAKVKTLDEADQAKTFRLLLVRKSESNHYGTFRKKFIKDNPFFESESIPEANSEVKFTKYEIGKKFNNPDPIDKATVADQLEDGVATTTTDDILGSR